jgi:hypothetical protein
MLLKLLKLFNGRQMRNENSLQELPVLGAFIIAKACVLGFLKI